MLHIYLSFAEPLPFNHLFQNDWCEVLVLPVKENCEKEDQVSFNLDHSPKSQTGVFMSESLEDWKQLTCLDKNGQTWAQQSGKYNCEREDQVSFNLDHSPRSQTGVFMSESLEDWKQLTCLDKNGQTWAQQSGKYNCEREDQVSFNLDHSPRSQTGVFMSESLEDWKQLTCLDKNGQTWAQQSGNY